MRLSNIIPRALASVLLVAAAASLVVACDFTKFGSLKDDFPAVRVDQPRASASFGELLQGVALEPDADRSHVAALGTGSNPAVVVISVKHGSGAVDASQTNTEQYEKQIGLEGRVPKALAAAPSLADLGENDVRGFAGPFAIVGATGKGNGRVVVFDANSLSAVGEISLEGEPLPAEYGVGLATGRFDTTAVRHRDVAIGANQQVWLGRLSGDWPRASEDKDASQQLLDDGPGDWPSSSGGDGNFSTIVAGNLNTANDSGDKVVDEVVIAAPGSDYVSVLTDVDACFGSDSCPMIHLPAPNANSQFGAALLIADIDADGANELLVGAPKDGSGKVLIYDFTDADFKDGTAPTPSSLGHDSAGRFGAALAFGRLTDEASQLLAVGAPGTDDGASSAGAILIYPETPSGADPKKIVTIPSAEKSWQVGLGLATVKYSTAKNETVDLLLSNVFKSGAGSALVFFGSLTDDHDDFRK